MSMASSRYPAHGYELAASIFSVAGDDLLVGGVPISEIVARSGTPAYVYDADVMRRIYRGLADILAGFADIHFSVKANPHPAVIRLFVEEGAGVEIASVGEYRAALRAGAAPETILFAGPGKRLSELDEVTSNGIGEIHIESVEEIDRLKSLGRPVRASLRINPVPSVQAGAMRMGGKPTAFGFDEEDLETTVKAVAGASNIDLVGVHIYGGTQILDAQALLQQWRHGIDIASRTARLIGKPLSTIDLGGGLGVPYYAGEEQLDLSVIASAKSSLTDILKNDPLLLKATIIVEPGRFLTGPAGVYVSEVNAVKISRGVRFLVTDGGMHHHLAASGNLGQVIKRSYPVVAATRMCDQNLSPAIVAGPLCTPLDVIGRDVMLPGLAAGDYVAVLQSGAYGPTASPTNFLSHPPPVEVIAERGSFRIL